MMDLVAVSLLAALPACIIRQMHVSSTQYMQSGLELCTVLSPIDGLKSLTLLGSVAEPFHVYLA